MLAFAAAIFSGAFLLFQVQPILGKYLLPWFGGGAGVWATCLVFFQAMLVAGYAYAHGLRRLGPRAQVAVHLAVLCAGALFLPIAPSESHVDAARPAWSILRLLTESVGVPYLALSGSSPLLAAWVSDVMRSGGRAGRGAGGDPTASLPVSRWRRAARIDVYRLFALSNLGSLVALLSYPVLIEPNFSRQAQAVAWAVVYGAFALATFAAGWRVVRGAAVLPVVESAGEPSRAAASLAAPRASRRPPASVASILAWVGFSALGSAMLVATTNQLSMEIAAVPMLWVIPLALYLFTFIVFFERPRWYDRRIFVPLFFVAVQVDIFALSRGIFIGAGPQIAIFPGAMFVVCAVMHGELARARPRPRLLTLFYLCVAVGGALGGAAVALGAPVLLRRMWDLELVLLVSAVSLSVLWIRALGRRAGFVIAALGAIVLFAVVLGAAPLLRSHLAKSSGRNLLHTRNFYGTLAVEETGEGAKAERELFHGQTLHGSEFMDPARAQLPTTYYGPDSGVGRVLRSRAEGAALRVAAVGLGVGTLAAYAKPGDAFTFYELNPAVERVAREYFQFLPRAGESVRVVIGDARLRMAEELRAGGAYDVIALDAFSSDSIPTHLLTVEAFDVYLALLKPRGVIAAHVSNRFLDLEPVLRAVAEARGLHGVGLHGRGASEAGISPSSWVILGRDAGAVMAATGTHEGELATLKRWPRELWTDDRSSLWPLLKFGE